MIPVKELKKQLKAKTDVSPDEYYPTGVLKEKGFFRKQCANCGAFFWSVKDDDLCGEPECSGGYSFIRNPVGKKMTFIETWKNFSSFFKKRGYSPIKRYPVAARWRDDTDFVQASIYDFQPHVVSGASKPPANPLVVPQYCLRFNSVENVGITGRHNTGFVMIGQHAFTRPERYDQPKYFRDMLEWFTNEVKIPAGEIKVHESQWGGGGNLGVSMEFFARGLELANQVYMMYKITDSGYEPLSIKVLDMGMGQDRPAWVTSGEPTIYDVAYPGVCRKIFERTGVSPDETYARFIPHGSVLDIDASNSESLDRMWKEISKKMGVDENTLKESIMPAASAYSIADHSQSLLFALNDGVLPSNIGGGYNLRAILRRSLGFIYDNEWDVSLSEVCMWHAEEWKEQYPELVENLEEIFKIIGFEEKKYLSTLDNARRKVEAVIKKTKDVDFDTLVKLYESDGVTPEVIREVARKQNVSVNIPSDFYSRVSQSHESSSAKTEEKPFEIEGLSATQRLYYERVLEFQAYVLKDWIQEGKHYVVMDKTAFYPESGGQDYDTGFMGTSRVTRVYKAGDVIVHEVEGPSMQRGQLVNCKVDEARRTQLMKHHTATHIINGAARRVLGNHVWQAGSEKKTDKARLDITHYDIPSSEELEEIERLANEVIAEARPIVKEVLSRSDAEQKYGFRLYQGGAIPSNEIRVVDIKEWDVEACGGTHADNTSEVEKIKLLKAKKIQDGVIRLEFVAGNKKISETLKKLEEEKQKKNEGLARKLLELDANADVEGKSYEELEELFKKALKEKKKRIQAAAGEADVSEDVVFLENADFKLMQEAGRKKVRENPESFVVIISNGSVFGIRGDQCPVDVESLVREACAVLGGKYGSKKNEFTGGGPNKERSREAFERARAMLHQNT
ncbi:MAG: alanine--tRNA ligase [archaeon]